MHIFTKINLGLTAIVFIGFGLWGLLAPQNMIGNLGLAFTHPGGATAIRAMYGGFLIGAGLLFAVAALNPAFNRFGLYALALIVGSILTSRLYGMAVDGHVSSLQISYAGIEASSLLLTSLSLWFDGKGAP